MVSGGSENTKFSESIESYAVKSPTIISGPMKTIWTSQPSSYKGNFVAFRDAKICPKPRQKPHPPLWIGGWTEAAMKRTAAVGDGWLPAWLLPQDIEKKFRRRVRQRPGRYPPRYRSLWMYRRGFQKGTRRWSWDLGHRTHHL